MTIILATTLERKSELKKSIDRKTALAKDDPDKAMNKNKVYNELKEVIETLNFKVIVSPMLYVPSLKKIKKQKYSTN